MFLAQAMRKMAKSPPTPKHVLTQEELEQAMTDTYFMKFKRGAAKDLLYEKEECRKYLLSYEDIDSEIGLFNTYSLEHLEFPLFS